MVLSMEAVSLVTQGCVLGKSSPQVPWGFENLGDTGLRFIPFSRNQGLGRALHLMTHALMADHRELSGSHLLLICSPWAL